MILWKEKPIPKYLARFDSSLVSSLSISLVSFCITWKHQKTIGFLKFYGLQKETNVMKLVTRKLFSNTGIYRKAMVWINPSCPDTERREKINLNFYFPLLCIVSKGFMKALKVFIIPFAEDLIFILKQHSERVRAGRVNTLICNFYWSL